MKKRRRNQTFTPGKTKAKLTFHDGFKEEPTHRITAYINEKNKGISMLELIQNKFSISEQEFKEAFKRKLSEWQKDAWEETKQPKKWELKDKPTRFTKDEKGRIISPFSPKAKELRGEE